MFFFCHTLRPSNIKTSVFFLGFYILAMFLLFSTVAVFAQSGGKISGAVKDSTGAVIPGSQVVLLNPANGKKQSTVTSGDGVFNFLLAQVGEYQLEVTANGFNPYRTTNNLKIELNTALTVDVVLQVAQNSETVMVTDNFAEIHTTDTQLGQTIGSKQVVDIPLNGRSQILEKPDRSNFAWRCSMSLTMRSSTPIGQLMETSATLLLAGTACS